ncbi:hypothetical protein KY290_024884 [Solanum tuberosum]|uniref:Zinc finger PMZ-type domain-containing protein n=1 Tax=Solanum tuberosum TaxID=4113 RepID=A0ABQ7UTS5_SOLTU|nr:hypothetical protein KY290_024884 [Solanum tuberosum]
MCSIQWPRLIEDFDKLMAKVVKIDNRIKMYLEDDGYEKWSRVHATVNMRRMMTSNIVECIKGCLVELDKIPCAHAFAVLKKKNIIDIHPYYSDYYKPAALANTYEVPMVPMPDKEDWSAPEFILEEIVLPPRYKRLAGRPRKRRKKNSGEKISTNTNRCGHCRQEDHNRRTCTFFPKED